MACCTETTRCWMARAIAADYYASRTKHDVDTAREVAGEYTKHLLAAGVIGYGTTAYPTDPATWDKETQEEGGMPCPR